VLHYEADRAARRLAITGDALAHRFGDVRLALGGQALAQVQRGAGSGQCLVWLAHRSPSILGEQAGLMATSEPRLRSLDVSTIVSEPQQPIVLGDPLPLIRLRVDLGLVDELARQPL